MIVRQTAGHMKFIFILSSYTQNSNWTQICRLAFFLFLKEKTQGEKKEEEEEESGREPFMKILFMTVLLMFLWGWQNAAKGYQMTVDVSE